LYVGQFSMQIIGPGGSVLVANQQHGEHPEIIRRS